MIHPWVFKRALAVVIVSLVVACAAVPGRADSMLSTDSANGGLLHSSLLLGFNGDGSVSGVDYTQTESFGLIQTDGFGISPATVSNSVAPASSTVAKDTASGTITTDFIYGAPFGAASSDTLLFSFSGTVSAVDAHNSALAPAAAFVSATGSLSFIIDRSGLTTGDPAGLLVLPALRPLAPTESRIELQVVETAPPSFFTTTALDLIAGDPATSLTLHAGSRYEIDLFYKAVADFGTDPALSFDYQTQLVVPEPSSWLLAASAACLAIIPRRLARCRRSTTAVTHAA